MNIKEVSRKNKKKRKKVGHDIIYRVFEYKIFCKKIKKRKRKQQIL